MHHYPQDPLQAVEALIKTATSLSQERDLTRLLDKILSAARQLTAAEGGRIYILDQGKRHLYPEIAQNTRHATPVDDLPVIPLFLDDGQQRNTRHVCAYCAFAGKPVNVVDVYRYSGFDCEDLYQYDRRHGYHTQSLLAVPLRSYEGVTSGVLQLLNYRAAADAEISAFPAALEHMAQALASQAAVALDNARLIARNRRLIEMLDASNRELTAENRELKQKIACHAGFNKTLVGDSPAMQQVFQLMEKILATDATVFIHGETGTGKELVARAIHEHSNRRGKAFIPQNCAAVPENLLESELFGYKRGAFSGADKDKQGMIEVADGGTLFLDEIGDMPLDLQAKMLRFLQDREVRPLGSVTGRQVDVRIVAATHRDLEQRIAEGLFREDLYYRLHVFPIEVPALRERRDDIPALLQHFLNAYNKSYNKQVGGFSPPALEALIRHDYPGNIRELRNIVERAVLLCDDGHSIAPAHLDKKIHAGGNGVNGAEGNDVLLQGSLKHILQHYEAGVLRRALQQNQWNQTRTAEMLAISRRALVDKISRYGLEKQ